MWISKNIVRPKHELEFLHSLLENVSLINPFLLYSSDILCTLKFTVPVHLASLPTAVGEPAGGSLTADQWLLMATVFGPVTVSP